MKKIYAALQNFTELANFNLKRIQSINPVQMKSIDIRFNN
jgi:hypothetical protein